MKYTLWTKKRRADDGALAWYPAKRGISRDDFIIVFRQAQVDFGTDDFLLLPADRIPPDSWLTANCAVVIETGQGRQVVGQNLTESEAQRLAAQIKATMPGARVSICAS